MGQLLNQSHHETDDTPPAEQKTRVTEDGAFARVTEDGLLTRVTEDD